MTMKKTVTYVMHQKVQKYQTMMVQAAKKGVLHKLNAGKAQILFVKLQKQDQFLTETVVSVKMNIVVTLQIASYTQATFVKHLLMEMYQMETAVFAQLYVAKLKIVMMKLFTVLCLQLERYLIETVHLAKQHAV